MNHSTIVVTHHLPIKQQPGLEGGRENLRQTHSVYSSTRQANPSRFSRFYAFELSDGTHSETKITSERKAYLVPESTGRPS